MSNGVMRITSVERCHHIKQAVGEILIGGYVMEFGVGAGSSLQIICNATDRKVIGFDSFEGLPENWATSKHIVFAKGSFKYEPPEIKGDADVELIHGWFKDTIPVWKEENKGPIAFLHIDSDLYSSCATVLTELNDQIKSGTILLFDELIDYEYWEQGEWKALQEWLAEYDREVYEIETYKTQATYRVIK